MRFKGVLKVFGILWKYINLTIYIIIVSGTIEGQIVPPEDGKGKVIIVAGGSYSGDLLGVHSAEIDEKIVGDICVGV